jgi:hypothetical protein
MNRMQQLPLVLVGAGFAACATPTRYTAPIPLSATEFAPVTLAQDPSMTRPTPRPDTTSTPRTDTVQVQRTETTPAPRSDSAVERRKRMPWEIAVGGAGSSNEDFDAGGAAASVSVGYFFNEVVAVSARQTSAYNDPSESGSGFWNSSSRAAIDLHIPLGNVYPYVGAMAGYVYGDTIRDTLTAGPEAGVKIFLKDDAFLQGGAEWQFFFDKGDSLETAFDDGQLVYFLSLGLRF